jgi:hypothetical protein
MLARFSDGAMNFLAYGFHAFSAWRSRRSKSGFGICRCGRPRHELDAIEPN